MDANLIYISNDDKQNYPYWGLKFLVEKVGHSKLYKSTPSFKANSYRMRVGVEFGRKDSLIDRKVESPGIWQ